MLGADVRIVAYRMLARMLARMLVRMLVRMPLRMPLPLLALMFVCLGIGAAYAQDPAPALQVQPNAQYQIGAGDTLTVQVYGEPALSGPFPVDDGGSLDFPLVGAVHVEGLTAADVAVLLRTRLVPDYLVNPNVTVWLAAYRSQPVQVLGAVAKPGLYFLHKPTTVLQILSEAGGVSKDGVNEVRITHGGMKDQVVVVPYDQLMTQGVGEFALAAGDIVFVPQSLVSVMGRVGKPGEIAFREGLTVSQSIAAAGGALPTAALGRVYILRGDDRIKVNLRKILSGKMVDLVVKPGDRIFVPESSV